MPSKPVLYLIDASSYVYRAFHALPPLTSPSGRPTNAVYGFVNMLLKLVRETDAQYLAAVFDAPGKNFRHEAYSAYKANREAMPDDLRAQIPVVHDVLASLAVRDIAIPGVEADDVIATLAGKAVDEGAAVVVVTGDKDLMQIVSEDVTLWDTMRDRRVDVAEVEKRLGVSPGQVVEIMGLMGDSVDNVPGVKGVGEKTARALIEQFGTIEDMLAHVDEVATNKGIRGAKKLAEKLRNAADEARLSRRLVELRRDVELEASALDDFRYEAVDPDMVRTLFDELGFQSLLRNMAPPARDVDVTLQPSSAETVVAAARAAGEIAVMSVGSFEGGRSDCDGVLVAIAQDVFSVDASEAAGLEGLWADPEIVKIGHDLKRDSLVLFGAEEPRLDGGFDTMVASYLTEASPNHQLPNLAADLIGRKVGALGESATERAPGVAVLAELRDRLANELAGRELDKLFYELEMPLVGVLARMEQRGLRVDLDVLTTMSRDMGERMVAVEREIYELAGGEFNIASPPQLRTVLFEKLGLPTKGVKKGKTGLSTDVDVLTKLSAEHPLPGKILAYRALAKLKSTYVDALPAAVNSETGRLHTRLNQTVAATGRLSSSDPNLQNIPIRTEEGRQIRSAFVAPEGHLLVGADYSQIELRLLAHLSGDAALLAAFRDDQDVHARTASEIFGVLPGAVSGDMRRAAKVINFGILYGMGPQRLARELAIPMKEAQDYIARYFERYSGVKAYMSRVLEQAREVGFVTTICGRRRSMADLNSGDRGAVQAAERMATNTPIQGSAADLIKLAMVSIDRRLRDDGLPAAMLLQVHDELLFEVEEDAVDTVETLVREEMEGAHPLDVPLRVDVRHGRSWADVH